jgi:tetratricopeptide (TPR) repeat protein
MVSVCFILMPYGQKADKSGRMINFDRVYQEIIRPAVETTDLTVIRADEEQVGGFIQKLMFERLILSDFAIADMTASNANVFYELGVRHTARPGRTLLLCAEGSGIPIDVQGLRYVSYSIGKEGAPTDVDETVTAIRTQILGENTLDITDSPVYQLLHELTPPEMRQPGRLRIEKSANEAEKLKAKIIAARKEGPDALRAVESSLGDLKQHDSSVAVELFFSYRNLKMFEEQINIVQSMPPAIAELAPVQEQLALALFHLGRLDDAENLMRNLLKTRPNSESFAAFGRIYKELWQQHKVSNSSNSLLARSFLDEAINLYVKGFECDWRNAYPGLNAITLMQFSHPPDPREKELRPVVLYSMERRIRGHEVDYYDASTMLELAVLTRNQKKAIDWLKKCLALSRAAWELKNTIERIQQMREGWQMKGPAVPWLSEIEQALVERMANFDYDAINYVNPRLRDRIAQTQPPNS